MLPGSFTGPEGVLVAPQRTRASSLRAHRGCDPHTAGGAPPHPAGRSLRLFSLRTARVDAGSGLLISGLCRLTCQVERVLTAVPRPSPTARRGSSLPLLPGARDLSPHGTTWGSNERTWSEQSLEATMARRQPRFPGRGVWGPPSPHRST